MTEEEARTKYCPIYMAVFPLTAATLKVHAEPTKKDLENIGGECLCCASDCAMWVSDGLDQIDGADYEIGHCGLINAK